MASSGGWLLPELVNELPDLDLGVAAMPTQGLHERQLALLGPAGHRLGGDRQQLGHLGGQQVAGCLAALALCRHQRVLSPTRTRSARPGPEPNLLVVSCGPAAETVRRSPCRPRATGQVSRPLRVVTIASLDCFSLDPPIWFWRGRLW